MQRSYPMQESSVFRACLVAIVAKGVSRSVLFCAYVAVALRGDRRLFFRRKIKRMNARTARQRDFNFSQVAEMGANRPV
jgi:hypothetical protein